MTYDELLNNLKLHPTKEQQIQELFNYLLNNVKYDYPTLEICNFDNTLLNYIDEKYNPSKYADKLKAVQLVREKGYSEEFLSRILEHYGEEFIVPARPERIIMGKLNKAIPEHTEYRTFAGAKNMATPSVIYKNGIIKKGVCADYSEFIHKICEELNIKCNVIQGTTPVSHVWNLIDVGDGFKHYDLTYAIFSRDNYNNWNSTNTNDWFGITTDRLLEMHPTRKIDASYLNNGILQIDD